MIARLLLSLIHFALLVLFLVFIGDIFLLSRYPFCLSTGLSSTIPSEIGTLTKLVFLDLDFNELTGSLPTSLYSLTDLETLDLNANFLEGDIDLMGVFNNLEFLQLQST